MLESLRRPSISLTLLLIVLPTLVLSRDVDIDPCSRAKYDANHNIQRTYAMVVAMYKSDVEQIDKYVYCYKDLTGIVLELDEPDRVTKKEVLVLVAIGLLVFAGLIYVDLQSIDYGFTSSGENDWTGM